MASRARAFSCENQGLSTLNTWSALNVHTIRNVTLSTLSILTWIGSELFSLGKSTHFRIVIVDLLPCFVTMALPPLQLFYGFYTALSLYFCHHAILVNSIVPATLCCAIILSYLNDDCYILVISLLCLERSIFFFLTFILAQIIPYCVLVIL